MKMCEFREECDDKILLLDAIFKVLSEEGLRRRFGEEGRKLVREEFGWKKVVGKMEDLYETILAK